GRLPFLLAGSPVLIAGLVGMGFIGAIGGLAAAAVVFFVGYFLAYEPYRALYPDAVPDEDAGRAQGVQALWRGAGTGLALLGGGLLLAWARPRRSWSSRWCTPPRSLPSRSCSCGAACPTSPGPRA